MTCENHQEEKLSVSPGFAPHPTFTLKRVEPKDEPPVNMAIESPRHLEISSERTCLDLQDTEAIKRSLKLEHRPWIIDRELQTEGESESKLHDMSLLSKSCLPKGVVRGCAECYDCQKVSARWDPDGACSCILEKAPVFRPHEEEFKDTLQYIDRIRQKVEPYGMCRIIPPPSWKSPSFLEEDGIWQRCKFSTQVQRVNELQNHSFCGKISDNETRDSKRRKLDYDSGDGCAANFISNECHGKDSHSESGPQFTLIAFKRYADYFQQHYFCRDADMSDPKDSPAVNQKKWELSELNIEGEYWRIIEKPSEEIEVLSATDLNCSSLGSEYSTSPNLQEESDYAENHTSGWNLNYVSRMPGSLLSFETVDSFSHFAPKMHVGMCFSSLPWTVEEHRLYKLHYLHLGAPRIWYSTSGRDSFKFEAVQKRLSLSPCRQHPELHCNMGRQLSPATLKSERIPVYRCIQRPREFVLFLPSAYHSGFDCGFNFSASAVFAPLDWLPHGVVSIELYHEQGRKTSISFDRMLLRAANEAVKAQWDYLLRGKTPNTMMWKEASGKDEILAKALRMRVRYEARCREYLSCASQSRKMDISFDDGDKKRECSSCCFDLYLSAASCPCNPNRFSCLRHTKHLCSCPWSDKIFFFRYLVSELEILVEAVEGKVTSIRRWVKDDLGMSLQQVYLDKTQKGPTQDPSCMKGSNGRTVSFGEDKVSPMKLLGEVSMGNPKGKELATSTLSDAADDRSSSSSSDMDIEAYVARLEALKRGKLCLSVENEVESGLKQTRESDPQLSDGGSVPRPVSNSASDEGKSCQIDNIICLSDGDDD